MYLVSTPNEQCSRLYPIQVYHKTNLPTVLSSWIYRCSWFDTKMNTTFCEQNFHEKKSHARKLIISVIIQTTTCMYFRYVIPHVLPLSGICCSLLHRNSVSHSLGCIIRPSFFTLCSKMDSVRFVTDNSSNLFH